MLKAALYYLNKLHYSVIPINEEKKSLVKWEEYQDRLPTQKEVEKWWTTYPKANIGVITGKVSNLAVIDIDDMVVGKDAIEGLVGSLDDILTPIAKTPSGLHVYFRYPKDTEMGNNAKLIEGCDFRGDGGYVVVPPSSNVKKGDYVWIKRPDKIEPLPLPDAYIAKTRDAIYMPATPVVITHTMFKQGTRDNDIFHVAHILAKNGVPEGEIRQIVSAVAAGCQPPFPQREADIKVNSAIERAYRKERNISDEIRQFVDTTDGYFSLNELSHYVVCTTPQDRVAIRVSVHRLCKDGILERTSSGNYRKVDKTLLPLDITGAIEPSLDIAYPLGIEKFINTYKKNLIVCAGSANAGKSAFLLNFARMNMDKHKVLYFSSEMGDNELKVRINNFKDLKAKDWKVLFYERSRNFADVIDPDAINIIDFMEIHQEHFLIGKWIKDIFDKLRNGIAVIAIQKKFGSNMGVGGHVTLEKPRLYVTIENGTIVLEKAKNWADGIYNPNGLQLTFKLIHGNEFIVTRGWHRQEEQPSQSYGA